jgi:hypothetical protein
MILQLMFLRIYFVVGTGNSSRYPSSETILSFANIILTLKQKVKIVTLEGLGVREVNIVSHLKSIIHIVRQMLYEHGEEGPRGAGIGGHRHLCGRQAIQGTD